MDPMQERIKRQLRPLNQKNVSDSVNKVSGNFLGLRGVISPKLNGNVTGITGDVSGIKGNIYGITGDVSGIRANTEEIRSFLARSSE